MRGGRRRRAGLLLAVAVLSAPSAGAMAQETPERFRETQDRLGEAQQQVANIATQIEQAQQALAAADAELAVASERLRAVETEVAIADAARREAQARTAAVTERLVAADDRLDRVLERWRAERADLRGHAADLYKRGAHQGAALFFAAVTHSGDVHEFVLNMRMGEAVLDHDRRTVERHEERTVDAAAARREVEELRAAHLAEEAEAQRLHDEAAALATAQQAATDAVATQRAEREQILARFEADEALTAELVRQLEEAVRGLQVQLLAQAADATLAVSADGPMPEWASRLPDHGRQWAPAIDSAATNVGLDPRLFAALVWAESYFQPGAVSRAGALGLAQLMPGTAARLGVDPYDPLQNLGGGARYLAEQLYTFGAVDVALAAYNAGPGAVMRHGGVPPYAETQLYVLRVLQLFQQLSA